MGIAVKINETLEDFLKDHPKLTVARNYKGKVVNIYFTVLLLYFLLFLFPYLIMLSFLL